jgi:hypothetical protein
MCLVRWLCISACIVINPIPPGVIKVTSGGSFLLLEKSMSDKKHLFRPADFIIGNKYNWKNQAERLVYLGCNWSGNGYWHQFAKIDSPDIVWCEVLDNQLGHFEETEPE